MTNRVENKILLFFPNVFADLSDNIFIGSSDYKFCLIVKWFALVEVFGDKRKKRKKLNDSFCAFQLENLV